MEALKVVRSTVGCIHERLLSARAAVPVCEMSERVGDRIKGDPPKPRDDRECANYLKRYMKPSERSWHEVKDSKHGIPDR